CILISKLVRHLKREFVDFYWGFGVEGEATGFARQGIERALCVSGLALFLLVQQADGINQNFALLGSSNQLFEVNRTGVVVAIRDNEQDLLLPLGLFLQVID